MGNTPGTTNNQDTPSYASGRIPYSESSIDIKTTPIKQNVSKPIEQGTNSVSSKYSATSANIKQRSEPLKPDKTTGSKPFSLDTLMTNASTGISSVGKSLGLTGGSDFDSEIVIDIVDIPNGMSGGSIAYNEPVTESSIYVDVVPLNNGSSMVGGGDDTDFDANKLLQAIMQSGGGDDDDDDDDDSNFSDSSVQKTVQTPSTSSFEPKHSKKDSKKISKPDKKHKKKNDDFDDSSSSSSSSDDFSDSSEDEFDVASTPVDFKSILGAVQKSKHSKRYGYADSDSESANLNSSVYVMSDNDSTAVNPFKDFKNPLSSSSRGSKRDKKQKKSKRY